MQAPTVSPASLHTISTTPLPPPPLATAPTPDPGSLKPESSSLKPDPSSLLRPRRREKRPEQWKRVQRKTRRVAGQEYVNTRGQLVQPKQMGQPCGCRIKCYSMVDEETRSAIFRGFYALNSYDEQNAYLFGLIRRKELLRPNSLVVSERRTCSYQYFVRSKGREIQVCKQAFANIHAISFKKIRTLSQKLYQNVMFPRDQRGKHGNRPSKISDETKDQVRSHICDVLNSKELRAFVKEDKVTGVDLNLSKMHKNYLKRHEPEAFEDLELGKLLADHQPRVKIWLYSNIYHSEFRCGSLASSLRRQPPDVLEPASSSSAGSAAEGSAGTSARPAARLRSARRPTRAAKRASPTSSAAPSTTVTPAPSIIPTSAPSTAAAPLLLHQLAPLAASEPHTDLMSLAVEQLETGGYQQLVLQPARGAAGAAEPLQLCVPLSCVQPLNLQAQPLNLHHTHAVFSVQQPAVQPAAGSAETPANAGVQLVDRCTQVAPGAGGAPGGQLGKYELAGGGEVTLVTSSAGGAIYDWQIAECVTTPAGAGLVCMTSANSGERVESV